MPQPSYHVARRRRSWVPWVRFFVVAGITLGAAWGILELAQRHLNLQKLTVEKVSVSGCRGDRQAEVQRIADRICLGRPLFWFDADRLRTELEQLRWVRGLLIRRDPPDRVAVVIEERKPLLWVMVPEGAILMSDDGRLLDWLNQASALPLPLVLDPASQSDEALTRLIRAAAQLRDRQPDFYSRVVEFRWTDRGPTAYIEGLQAPIYLSKVDAAKNIPNFQGLYLDQYAGRPGLERIRYFDLRWDEEISVGEMESGQAPKAEAK